jgi:protein-S-isoprenylcysteine O-methyltransferase Ste14
MGLRVPPPPLPARTARPAAAAWNVAKTFAQMTVFWVVFLGLIPAAIVWAERRLGWSGWGAAASDWPWNRAAGAVLFLIAGTLGVSSAWVMASTGQGTPLPFDCPRRLVVRGPYRYVRNPMAIAGLAQGAAVGVYLGSWAVLAYTACGWALWNFVIRVWEEDDLRARFGPDFERYCARVRCWWPRWGGCDEGGELREAAP